MNEEQKLEQLEKQKQSKRVTLAFQSLTQNENGRLVLNELSKMCNENVPTYVDQNPNGTAYKEGQRSIILGIRNKLNKTFNQLEQKEAKL